MLSPISTNTPETQERFGISAASRLTGISVHTLRIWERRHSIVDPGRTDTRRRSYSRNDIRRLTLIKSLVDHGEALRNLAPLTSEALETRWREVMGYSTHPGKTESLVRVAFAGSLSRDALREAADGGPGLQIVGEFPDLAELEATLRPGAVDLLVLECQTLFPETIATLRESVTRLGARRALAIFRFAPREAFQAIDIPHIAAMQAPVGAGELRLAILADAPVNSGPASPPAFELRSSATEIPGRTFTETQLARISRRSSVVACECPRHLANLISSLTAFEKYSAECESRNEADARLHAFLHRATAESRFRMETALRQLMEAEGINLDN